MKGAVKNMEDMLWIFEFLLIGGILVALAAYFFLKCHVRNKNN